MARSPRHARRGPPGGSTLAPLRWIAQEDLVYDQAALTLHRSSCPRLCDVANPTRIPAGSALEVVWAPGLCSCGPDVTLGLG
jgi:hypothetical protein